MKNKYLIGTILLSFIIVAAGFFGISALYPAIFDVASVIDTQEALPDSTATAPKHFIESLQFPMFEQTKPLSEKEFHDYLLSHYLTFEDGMIKDTEPINADDYSPLSSLYERLFGLVNLTCKEKYWRSLSVVTGQENYYVLKIPVQQNHDSRFASVALKDSLPVLIHYQSETKPSAREMEDAVETLKRLADSQDDFLKSYFKKIDDVYEGCAEYKNQVDKLYEKLLDENQVIQGATGSVSLYDCCLLGNWQVYADDNTAALVCMMGRSYVILFYDAAEQQFSGFHFDLETLSQN